jgi:DNA-binding CsgD family transcriptional regulator
MLALLPLAVAMRVGWDLFAGDLAAAAAIVAEQDTVLEAIGSVRSPTARIALAAFCGREAEVSQLDEATTSDAVARGEGQWVVVRHWSAALLYNGLGRYEEALGHAQQGAGYAPDMGVANWALTELVEAAARCGRPEAAAGALGRLAEMAQACRTDWILGIEARSRAFVSDPADADPLYLRAIEHLGRTVLRAELARSHLVYGEWLRREGRGDDAREHLRVAYDILTAIGMEAFADRARSELQASGEKVRTPAFEARDELTAQERQIARLAREGLSNPEIGARLFLSPRTVEWHLRNVYAKVGIHSRRELSSALPGSESRATLA